MNRFVFAPALLLVMGLMVDRADAAFQVTFKVDAASTTVVDGGAGDLDGLANGTITVVTLSVGAYTFSLTLSTTNSTGTPMLAFVDASTSSISGTGAAMVSVFAKATDFTMPGSPPDVKVVSSSTAQVQSGTKLDNKVEHSYAAYYDSTNTLTTSAIGTAIGSDGPVTLTTPLGASNLGDTEIHTFATIPYALSLELNAKFLDSGANKIDLDGGVEVTPVPEPISCAAWGGMLLLGCLAARRRRRGGKIAAGSK